MTSKIAEILEHIDIEDKKLHKEFAEKLKINYDLDRTLVSFQANKAKNGNRWFKYKEGFSYDLVRYILDKIKILSGCILDPFAGSGATLFTASDFGIDSIGIELLLSSAEIIEVRNIIRNADPRNMMTEIRQFKESKIWQRTGKSESFKHLRITGGAFPKKTEEELSHYIYEVKNIKDDNIKRVLLFAALCILENVSYTRKDGQYLRWDYRSGRNAGKKQFNKGNIKEFTTAICEKIDEIAGDMCENQLQPPGFLAGTKKGKIELIRGSCLDILPSMRDNYFDGLITSPPYCNRYDYTRTYALELAMLGITEDEIRNLRQRMMSCTVENREKEGLGANIEQARYKESINAFESQKLLSLIISYLDKCRDEGLLNNAGIARMVRNYFKELTVVIFECARLLKPGARFVMVNDNVRYQGVHIPVDLIISEIAQKAGFNVEEIWVLPIGKGNSSQQMRVYGREELRKCVYIWRNQKEISQEDKSETC